MATRSLTAFDVQAVLLYSIVVYWCNEPDRGVELLDEAVRMAISIGMNRKEFSQTYGHGDSFFEESLRRSWWVIYITDAHIAGSTHTYPFRTSSIDITTDLPCEEDEYESGVSELLHMFISICYLDVKDKQLEPLDALPLPCQLSN